MTETPDLTTKKVLRSLVWPVFLPCFIYASGTAAIIPVIPLEAIRLGLSPAQASALTMVVGIVTMIGPIPAGRLADRIGERNGLLLGSALAVLSLIGLLVAISIASLPLFLIFLMTLAYADLTWDLGRMLYLADHVDTRFRAKAITTFGGSMRVGKAVGPALGAGVLLFAPTIAVFGIHLVGAIIAGIIVMVKVAPSNLDTTRVEHPDAHDAPQPRRNIAIPLILVAIGVVVMQITRHGRDLIIPLLGHHLGLSAVVISAAFAAAAVIDIFMVVPAAIVMDRFGRIASLVPALCGMGAAFIIFPMATTEMSFILLAVMFAIGNGVASGINKTLGADMTPTVHRAKWVGLWNSLTGSAALLGPGLIAALTAVFSVTMASVGVGIVALGGAAWSAFWLPRLLPLHARSWKYQARKRAEAQPEAHSGTSPNK